MSKIGLNINLGSVGDWNRLIQVLRGMTKTRAHLIMTGGGEPEKERRDVINLINTVGNPNTLYFHRLYSREEGHWRNLTPERFRPILQAMPRHPQIVTEQPTNEPDGAEHPDFVANQLGHLAYAQEANQPIALGTWGVGGPHEYFIDNGGYDDLYRGIHNANQRQRGSAYLSKHEYHLVWPEAGAGFDDIPYEVLLEPKKLRQYMKPKAAWDIRRNRWLIRTSDFEALRCHDVLKIPVVPMVFTEYGWDGVDDPITKLNHLVYAPGQTPQGILEAFNLNPNATNTGFYDKLRDKYIVYPYNGLRGVGANRHILKAIFPELTFQQAVQFILQHHNNDILWPDHIIGACLFTWSYNGEWGGEKNTSGHNYGQEGLDDVLMAVGSLPDPTPIDVIPAPIPVPTPEPEPTPEPVPAWDILRIQGNGTRVNVRTAPDANSPAIGTLAAAPTVTTVAVSVAAPLDPNGMQWRQVQFNGLEGWLAFRFIVDAPEPARDPRIPLVLEALRAVRNWDVDDVGEKTERILYVDSILAQLETTA